MGNKQWSLMLKYCVLLNLTKTTMMLSVFLDSRRTVSVCVINFRLGEKPSSSCERLAESLNTEQAICACWEGCGLHSSFFNLNSKWSFYLNEQNALQLASHLPIHISVLTELSCKALAFPLASPRIFQESPTERLVTCSASWALVKDVKVCDAIFWFAVTIELLSLSLYCV